MSASVVCWSSLEVPLTPICCGIVHSETAIAECADIRIFAGVAERELTPTSDRSKPMIRAVFLIKLPGINFSIAVLLSRIVPIDLINDVQLLPDSLLISQV